MDVNLLYLASYKCRIPDHAILNSVFSVFIKSNVEETFDKKDSISVLQNLQNRVMRFYYVCTHLLQVRYVPWFRVGPLDMYRKIEAVKLFNRLINMSDNRLTKNVYVGCGTMSEKLVMWGFDEYFLARMERKCAGQIKLYSYKLN